MSFVHLHVHSHYSLLDGLSKIDELVEKAVAYHMPAVALTDHGVMYGIIDFYQKCKKAGIKPIVGVEAYLAPKSRFDKQVNSDARYYHLTLLAQNLTGYKNLTKLVTSGQLEGYYYKPRIDWDILKTHAEGLICLSGCLKGELAQAIAHSNLTAAGQIIQKYIDLFGKDNYYLEVQHHIGIPEQNQVNQILYRLAEEYNLKTVATNDVHYLDSEDAEAHDTLICLQTKSKKFDKNRMSYLHDDFSFRSPQRMKQDFRDHPESIATTLEIAEKCNLDIPMGNYLLPSYELPVNVTAEDELKKLCLAGLINRYPGHTTRPEIITRLEYELAIINKTGFASYFLIVQDFVNWAKNNNIIVGPGRGSAAGSIVAYLTNITNIDPLQYDLIFERFLNPDRISMPDIDLDFADTRRDEVLHYVENKYGHDHVSQIITFGTMAARVAVRDVGRVLGVPYSFCDQLAKLIPMFTTLDQALKIVPELKEKYENEDDARSIIDTARKLEGISRHTSTHACGVVITPEPLINYLPLQYAASEDKTIITQYSLHAVEDLGLLKMDFLGLRNLTLIETAIEIIEKIHNQKINIEQIPLTDQKTFRLLQLGDTTGVFQLESSGMRRYLKALQPTELEDIIAMVSLYRPGPMEFIQDYIDGKHGKKKIFYLEPRLIPILEKTYGIAVYQEQIMEIARELAGFTYAEADVLRKAVGKKIKSLLDTQEKKMIEGMIARNIQEKTAKKIWEFILPFARYGFNRAHAACYAMIAYQTAYLKANYPTEFMAALLTANQNNLDRIAIDIEECKKMNITVLPPDINESYSTFTVVAKTINDASPRLRFGLKTIKNVGLGIAKAIIKERKENGPFKNLEDLLYRIYDKDLNKKSLESMIKSGTLDNLGERGQMLANLETLLQYNKSAKKDNDSKQTNLFGINKQQAPKLNLKNSDPTPENIKLTWEKELLGLYISSHPLKSLAPFLQKTNVKECRQLAKLPNQIVTIVGVVEKVKRIITRKNESMVFATLEDYSGSVEVIVFPSLYKTTREIWLEGNTLLVKGKVSNKDNEIKILAEEARKLDLEQIKRTYGTTAEKNTPPLALASLQLNQADNQVYLELPVRTKPKFIEELKKIFYAHPGEHKVLVLVKQNKGIKKIATNFSISYNEIIRKKIELVYAENNE
jgi:DNA polymerase-3 subunit alpha